MENKPKYKGLQLYASYDPTYTTGLRNAFSKDIKKRFDEIANIITKAIVDEDVFALDQPKFEVNAELTTPGATFNFPRSAEKVEKFNIWLNSQVKAGILDVKEFQQVGSGSNSAWTNKYIYDSYKRGVQRARYELEAVGLKNAETDLTGTIETTLSSPFHIDRLGLIYSRTYSDLKGITDAMENQISKVLAQGLADGDNPKLLARKLRATITGDGIGDLGITDTLGRFIPAKRRAEMLARTEVIRAHHLATIQEYRNWGLENVKVKVEWQTAEDGRVCDKCASLNGKIFTLDEIETMIPLHPNCRCVALPYVETKSK